jgi:hypothetical protein
MLSVKIQDVPFHSLKNRDAVEQSTECACYRCCAKFDKNEVINWTDHFQTAICPYCGTDSVLPDFNIYPITKEFLEEAKNYWFQEKI